MPLEAPVTIATLPRSPFIPAASRFIEPGSSCENGAKRIQPLRHRFLEEVGAVPLLLGGTLNRHRPFDERPVPIDDRRDPSGAQVIGYRPERLAGLIGVRPFEVRMSQQPLPNSRAVLNKAADSADGVTRFAF